MRGHDDSMAQPLRSSSLPAGTSKSAGQWQAEPHREKGDAESRSSQGEAVPAAPSLPTRGQQRHPTPTRGSGRVGALPKPSKPPREKGLIQPAKL